MTCTSFETCALAHPPTDLFVATCRLSGQQDKCDACFCRSRLQGSLICEPVNVRARAQMLGRGSCAHAIALPHLATASTRLPASMHRQAMLEPAQTHTCCILCRRAGPCRPQAMMCGRGGMSGPLCSGAWTRARLGRRWQPLCLCPSSRSPSTARSCCASCTTSGPNASRYLPLHGHPPAQGLCRASCGSGCLRGRCSLPGQCPVLHRLAAACFVWKLPATHDGRRQRRPE